MLTVSLAINFSLGFLLEKTGTFSITKEAASEHPTPFPLNAFNNISKIPFFFYFSSYLYLCIIATSYPGLIYS